MKEKIKLDNKRNLYIASFMEMSRENLSYALGSIKQTNNGFAGFAKKEYLLNHVRNTVFSESSKNSITIQQGFHDITSLLVKDLKLVRETYKTKGDIEIYLFPTLSNFVKEKMDGMLGFAPYTNVMHLYIHEDTLTDKNVSTTLQNTVAHEYNHLMRYEHFLETETLLDDLIFEGLAENFREAVFPGKQSPWSIALNKNSARETFLNLKPTLLVKNYDFEIYNALFFGNDAYKLWTGYSIGYHLVKDYLNSMEGINWKEIMKTQAKQIATESGWL
jgi:uncharacterized protein YjaZ